MIKDSMLHRKKNKKTLMIFGLILKPGTRFGEDKG